MIKRWIPAIACLLTIALYLGFLTRDYPLVGHDFAEFIPRLIDTDIHIRINGLAPQLYTPTFGGGLPAFFNPQHWQYSLIQMLLLVMGPWVALMTSTALVSAIGFAAMYAFLASELGLGVTASTLGAMSVIANGFYIEHLVAGQLPFQLYPLIGVLTLFASSQRVPRSVAAVVCALTMAAIVHAGGGLMAIYLAGSLVLILQVISLLHPRVLDWRRVVIVLSGGAVLALAMCASKLYAVRAFMAHFPRELSDSYPIGVAHALFGLGSQLAGGLTILPMLVAGGYLPQRIDDALVWATGAGVHVWELDVAVPPMLVIALVVAIARVAWLWSRGDRSVPLPRLEIALLIVTTWIAIETTLAKGVIYPRLHELPFFRSMHINHRAAVVFIMPIVIAGATALDRWRPQRRMAIGVSLVAISLLLQSSYFLLPDYVQRRWYDISQNETDHAMVRRGERFPIAAIDEIPEPQAFTSRTSARIPYEPLFGYDNEHFAAETVNGPVDMVRDGKFNMTNPASFVFPELNGLQGPFERIHLDDRENLDRFVSRRQPTWKHPAMLDWLNRLGAITFLICLIILFVGLGGRGKSARSRSRYLRARLNS